MLPRMLLHVVNSARPVYFPMYRPRRHFSGSVMNNMPLSVSDFENIHSAELSRVVRLPSRRGIKCGAIQYYPPPPALLFARNHLRVEIRARTNRDSKASPSRRSPPVKTREYHSQSCGVRELAPAFCKETPLL